jgi:hypothetical protein
MSEAGWKFVTNHAAGACRPKNHAIRGGIRESKPMSPSALSSAGAGILQIWYVEKSFPIHENLRGRGDSLLQRREAHDSSDLLRG